MDRPSCEFGEERAFRDAVGVDVGETGHDLIEDRVQLPIIYVPADPIYAVLFRAVIRHLLGGLETEYLGVGGGGHAVP